jgi:hypothetical protein
MWQYNYTDELYHHGVKGMRWGIRRFQKKNGSLTPMGKKRRASDTSEDRTALNNIRKKNISEMSNKELQAANQRLQLERQYKDLTKKKGRVKKAIDVFIGTATTITAVTAAAAVYKKVGGQALDKIGDWIIKDIKF